MLFDPLPNTSLTPATLTKTEIKKRKRKEEEKVSRKGKTRKRNKGKTTGCERLKPSRECSDSKFSIPQSHPSPLTLFLPSSLSLSPHFPSPFLPWPWSVIYFSLSLSPSFSSPLSPTPHSFPHPSFPPVFISLLFFISQPASFLPPSSLPFQIFLITFFFHSPLPAFFPLLSPCFPLSPFFTFLSPPSVAVLSYPSSFHLYFPLFSLSHLPFSG